MRLQFQNRCFNEMGRTASHLYIRPHPLLQPYVAHYTITMAGGEARTDTLALVPDASGCLIFGPTSNGLQGTVYGATTRTVVVNNDLDVNPLRLFVEFLPGGLGRFLCAGPAELTDLRPALSDVDRGLERAVAEAYERAEDLDAWVCLVEQLLLRRLPPDGLPAPLCAAMAHGRGAGGQLTVAHLAALAGYSERQVNRMFRDHVGVSAKTFLRLVRINGAIQRMQRREVALTTLAQESGFYDQSHFIREFKAVCGVTPRQYLEGMSGFYNEALKF
ncbi:helix-turn-helix transcriptional regulator [Clostridiaceae bacterium NSJ-31]|uniref:Helix-turn-helix transcriptional regulator n=1 Tax=Ligaoa zhengdingensis TaxID=2763658 RepID=A0A926E0W6_9FIRM|nr:helix-turn-helix transcriptional regulator [Ligaoa zhengdingensis]MBC8546765.1 helix-turn-helix transcriptional regulator [Ligaoa zhengdingensis]